MAAPSEAAASIALELREWQSTGPAQDRRLGGLSLPRDPRTRSVIENLRGRIDLDQGYDGLEVTTSSHVGRVDIGPLRLTVTPKLPALPLTHLLRYAYGLRDLDLQQPLDAALDTQGLHELLAIQLAAEADELLRRGLARQSVLREAELASPRGRIRVDAIVRRGGLHEARLPCAFAERSNDWTVNRVLRAGLEQAARQVEDPALRRRLQRLADGFGDVAGSPLSGADIEHAQRGLTRLTAAYAPALTLVRLLHDHQGVALAGAASQPALAGFLFDMNAFFQRLMSRFLHEHLPAPLRIEDEHRLRGLYAADPANRSARRLPGPRPDYALFDGPRPLRLLDAKYRELWRSSLPADWLYQLTIYALASPDGCSVLLYASTAADGRDERIVIRPPLEQAAARETAVVLRPVPLPLLAELVSSDRGAGIAAVRRELAGSLVAGSTHATAFAPLAAEARSAAAAVIRPPI